MEGLIEFIEQRDEFLAKFRNYIGLHRFDHGELVTNKRVLFHRNGASKKTEAVVIRAHPVNDTIKVYNENTDKKYWVRLSKDMEFFLDDQ